MLVPGSDGRRFVPLFGRLVGFLFGEVEDRQIEMGELAARVDLEDGREQVERLIVVAACVQGQGQLRLGVLIGGLGGQYLVVQALRLRGLLGHEIGIGQGQGLPSGVLGVAG